MQGDKMTKQNEANSVLAGMRGEAPQEAPQEAPEQPQEAAEKPQEAAETKAKRVNLWGIEVELPEEAARRLIAVRDEKTKEYNSVVEREREAARKAQEEAKRAALLEKAKNGEIEQIEKEFSHKYESQIQTLKRSLIEKELDVALSKNDKLAPDFREDVRKLIQAESDFEYVEGKVRMGDRSVESVVNDWIEKKPVYHRAPKAPTKMGGEPTSTRSKPQVDIGKALAQRFGI
jgi:hypothetical protein